MGYMVFPHGERVRLEHTPVDRLPWVEGLGYQRLLDTHTYVFICLLVISHGAEK